MATPASLATSSIWIRSKPYVAPCSAAARRIRRYRSFWPGELGRAGGRPSATLGTFHSLRRRTAILTRPHLDRAHPRPLSGTAPDTNAAPDPDSPDTAREPGRTTRRSDERAA